MIVVVAMPQSRVPRARAQASRLPHKPPGCHVVDAVVMRHVQAHVALHGTAAAVAALSIAIAIILIFIV